MDNNNYSLEVLQGLSRKEIQTIAKEKGFKANKSNNELIKEILSLNISLETDIKNDAPDSVEPELNPKIMGGNDAEKNFNEDISNFEQGKYLEFILADNDNNKQSGIIKKVNKKSAKIQIESGEEITVKFENLIYSKFIECSQEIMDQIEMILPESFEIEMEVQNESNKNTPSQADIDSKIINLKTPIESCETISLGPFSTNRPCTTPKTVKVKNTPIKFKLSTPVSSHKVLKFNILKLYYICFFILTYFIT
jgi:hypothetical protein